jgi:hypothetical protein
MPPLYGVIGETVTISARKTQGPAPLACADARMELTDIPLQGLFQDGLGDEYAVALANLALNDEPLAGISLTCDAGIFEFHFVSTETGIIGLDNRV